MRDLIETIVAEEVEEAVGARPSARGPSRVGYRHGTRPRRLTLRGGRAELRVPRARLVDGEGGEREWRSRLAPRYRRETPEAECAVLGVCLSGGTRGGFAARWGRC